jgi:cysteine synthase
MSIFGSMSQMKVRNVLPEGARYIHQIPPTPLVPVSVDGSAVIWCKLEFMNPSGSTKDRIARHILEKGWRAGLLKFGSTVVEASSGSTSIAFALASSQLELKFVAFIPEHATSERESIIRAYGGEVRRVQGTGGTLRGLYEAFSLAGCDVSAHAAMPRQGELFGSNLECCSLNFAAALQVAADLGEDAKIVTIFPDRMERYFSHKVSEGYRA